MYKINNHLSPLPMQELFTEKLSIHDLRNKRCWETHKARTAIYGTETVRYRGPKTWELVPTSIKKCKSLIEFKDEIKHWKPQGCTGRLCKPYIHNLGFID